MKDRSYEGYPSGGFIFIYPDAGSTKDGDEENS